MDRAELIAAMRATAAHAPIPVQVPGWGDVYVRPPTVAEVDAASDVVEPEGTKRTRFARGAARIMCDAHGARIFDPLNEEDVNLLADQPWSMLQQVLQAAGGQTSGN